MVYLIFNAIIIKDRSKKKLSSWVWDKADYDDLYNYIFQGDIRLLLESLSQRTRSAISKKDIKSWIGDQADNDIYNDIIQGYIRALSNNSKALKYFKCLCCTSMVEAANKLKNELYSSKNYWNTNIIQMREIFWDLIQLSRGNMTALNTFPLHSYKRSYAELNSFMNKYVLNFFLMYYFEDFSLKIFLFKLLQKLMQHKPLFLVLYTWFSFKIFPDNFVLSIN